MHILISRIVQNSLMTDFCPDNAEGGSNSLYFFFSGQLRILFPILIFWIFLLTFEFRFDMEKITKPIIKNQFQYPWKYTYMSLHAEEK